MKKIIYIILGILYTLSPYDAVPDFLMGWGWLDDIIVLGLLARFLYTYQKRKTGYRNQFYQQRFRSQYQQHQQGAQNAGAAESFQDPYQVLGVSRDAGTEEIKTAYRKLVNQYHPDKVQHLGDEFKELAEKRFREIQEAYNTLK